MRQGIGHRRNGDNRRISRDSASGESKAPRPAVGPVFESTCLITAGVKRMVEFYEQIMERHATWSGSDYAEFATGAGTLAIFSVDAQERYIPGSAERSMNKNVIFEFKLADDDAEYLRIKDQVKTRAKPPTTQPWGTRSIDFRGPDGDPVDFYSLVQAS